MPWADGALPDTEIGLGWGVNWVVRSPEAMGGKQTLAAFRANVCFADEADVHFLGLERPFLGRNEDQLCIRASPNLA